MEKKNKVRPVAIYLPQFHPTLENNKWWGQGFTEWTNVTKAKPLKRNHYQPHLPTELGFYDLRVSETRIAQAELAKEYGIYGFCYYHYWFNGRRILERPFQEVFESGKPDFPFMLCWANENWTRVWDGGTNSVLLEQNYTLQDSIAHIRSLIPFFLDPRYIRIDNKPVFAIYRSTHIPIIEDMIVAWREEAAKYGLELYLCRFETFGAQGKEYLDVGFDAAIEFQPNFGLFNKKANFYQKVKSKIRRSLNLKNEINKSGAFIPYMDLVTKSMQQYNQKLDYKLYRTVCPSWDNSARRKVNFMVFLDSTPELFKYWIIQVLNEFEPYSEQENLFFINAWNEWAEGNHLEPDRKWGRGYLESLKSALG